MLKKALILLLFCFILHAADAQPAFADSVKLEINTTKNDTLRLVLLSKLTGHYFDVDYDQLLLYAKQMLQLAIKLNYKIEEAYAMELVGIAMSHSRQPETLETYLKAAAIVKDKRSESNILPKKYLYEMDYYDGQFMSKDSYSPQFLRLDILGSVYFDLGNFYGITLSNTTKQLTYYKQAKDIFEVVKDSISLPSFYAYLADNYNIVNQLDSGLYYSRLGNKLSYEYAQNNYASYPQAVMGIIYYKKNNQDSALRYLHQAIDTWKIYGKAPGISRAMLLLSDYHEKNGHIDSSLYYAQASFKLAEHDNDYVAGALPNASATLARLYKTQNNKDSALKYYALTVSFLNTMHNDATTRLIQSQDYVENMQQQEIAAAKIDYKNKLRLYVLLAGIGILLIIGIILYSNNHNRKKANELLQKQKEEIEQQKKNVEETLAELKSTQAQLIQSEKMASLGELTAGIAHEIQNPLNFVNNFSEVNTELIEEMKTELKAGNTEDAIAIANDIADNEQKINHHGKRADSIVKGMLQHSRSSTGAKEPTDINALADEYLRLSYHGLRAKDKSFNATIETNFDERIGKINVMPQDMGRVLLNLLTNAFYAVNEKKNQGLKGYEPTVTVKTLKIPPSGGRGAEVLISVKDNGNGIPQKVIDKIFQPFFTTKPTGEGTGLGLSLSYDIVKAHGGEIKVETLSAEAAAQAGKEGEGQPAGQAGTEFIIHLPV